MSDNPAVSAAARPRSRSRAQRLARRRERAADDGRLLTLLMAGVATDELALQEGVSPRRMRERIDAMLARRGVDSPAAFVPLQTARLGDALKVAYAAMMDGDLKALDRYLRVLRELERYHGYRPPEPQALAPAPRPARLAAPAQPRALPAPDDGPKTENCIASR
jgi:hypothetical protein